MTGPVVVSPETAPELLAPPLLSTAPVEAAAPVLAPPPSLPPLLAPPVGSSVVPLSPTEAPVIDVTAVTPPEFPAV